MRKYLLVVGGVFLVVALAVLFDGNSKLATLSACSTLEICTGGVSYSSPELGVLIGAARLEVIYGIVFTLFSIVLLFFGVFGRSSGNRQEDRRNLA